MWWLNNSSCSALGMIGDMGDACGLRDKNVCSWFLDSASAEEF